MKLLIITILLGNIFIPAAAQEINYYKNIQPLIQSHCLPCHHKNNVGAMPLENYKQVSAYGRMIAYTTENKLMPPWKADAGYSHLKDYNNLTKEEIELIKAWVNAGVEEGKDIPGVNKTASVKEKLFPTPDMVIAMKESYLLAGDYTETAQVFVIPSNLEEEKYIDAIEFVPGNKKIVKSCTVSIDTGNTGALYDSYDLNYGYLSLNGLAFIPCQYNWYQWTADEGASFYTFPYAKKIPAGSNLLLHISYAASTTIQKDSSILKLHFAAKTDSLKTICSQILFDTTNITNGPFVINVGDKRKFFAEHTIDKPVKIYSVMPMGQHACSSWEIYAIDHVTGQRINILKIPHWDAHWKKKYYPDIPIRLSAGSTIFGVAYYNNGDDNTDLIILPPKKIKNGEGQRDELFVVGYDLVELKSVTE